MPLHYCYIVIRQKKVVEQLGTIPKMTSIYHPCQDDCVNMARLELKMPKLTLSQQNTIDED